MEQLLTTVLAEYGIGGNNVTADAIGSGLIHATWKITVEQEHYILQKVNHGVFADPQAISDNIKRMGSYLQLHHPHYLFVEPITTLHGSTLVMYNEEFYRLFPFVKKSYTYNVVAAKEPAKEAAAQFGRFTKLLSRFDSSQLKITIPSFHDLDLRYQQFLYAVENGNMQRIKFADALIQKLMSFSRITDEFIQIKNNLSFRLRVTHHDTKISNVLFNEEGKGLCVIDLDTVMPGYFISDAGDMMRTYLSPVSEEEQDFSKIEIREEIYQAITEGYYSEMKDELTNEEKKYFFYAGEFMIYMQSIRFLTDYLNDDLYYTAAYDLHNYNRAFNQTILLEKYMAAKERLLQYSTRLF